MVLRRTVTSTSWGKKSYLVGLHRHITKSHEEMSWVCLKLSSLANPLPCLPKFILAQTDPSVSPGQWNYHKLEPSLLSDPVFI